LHRTRAGKGAGEVAQIPVVVRAEKGHT
jgi:hypothetical protein